MLKKKQILLINPPGKIKYHRDYYCSESPKGDYLFQPVDLLYQSGILKNYFDLFIVDAIAEDLTPDETLLKIAQAAPEIEFCFGLISGTAPAEDLNFYRELKEKYPNIKICVSGDYAKSKKLELLNENIFLDTVLLNFFSTELSNYWLKKPISGADLITKSTPGLPLDQKNIAQTPVHQANLVPAYAAFRIEKYKFPFAKHKKYMTVLTDFSCPYTCSYCPMGNMDHFFRDFNTVEKELIAIKDLNIKELFIRDQSFGFNIERTKKVLSLLKEQKFSWTCFVRPETFSQTLAKQLFESGCHTIILGIESENDTLLKKFNRNSSNEKIKNVIELARKAGLRVVATVIFGLPKDNINGMEKTLEYVLSSKVDFVSFNVATARYGTQLYQEALTNNWIDPNDDIGNSGRQGSLWRNLDLDSEQINQFTKRAYLKFYFRPGYLLNRFFKLRSFYEAKNLFAQALGIILNKIHYQSKKR